MSETFICPWCKKETQRAHGIIIQSFILSFEEGVDSYDPGYRSTCGYEIEDMCTECAYRLKDELIKLGIDVMDTGI